MEIGKLKEGFQVKFPQPENDILPSLPLRMLALAPSGQGKTNALVTMIVDKRFYRGKFEKIFWCSPTATVDPALDPLRDYVKNHLKQDQEREPTFHDGIPVEFLQTQVNKAKKVMEFLKKRREKQHGFNILIVLDDLADTKRGLPEIARFVDSAFVKLRHWGISIILSTQKLRLPLISPTVRVNITAMLVWRLRSRLDLDDGFLFEMSALVDKDMLKAAYEAATKERFGFLYINLLNGGKGVNHMFYSGFSRRFVMDKESDD
tara:strand:+ start:1962 stop:2747 length:786 start_codon:yes stop_codon:yes gene_type:complete